jgi:Alkylmercury lyase
MTKVVVMTADEIIALDVDGRGQARRTARETPLARQILRAFHRHGGPVPVEDIAADRDALAALDSRDLIRVRDGSIDIAYPFSALPTAFVVRLRDGGERYACCATDALGIAPMIGEPVEIRTRCHHCGASLTFSATPEGPGLDADGIMLWIGKRSDEPCRAIDSL